MKLRTEDEQREIYNRFRELLEQGMTIKEAAGKIGVSHWLYGNYRAKFENAPLVKSKKANKKAKKRMQPVVSFAVPLGSEEPGAEPAPAVTPDDRVVILIGKSTDVNAALERLTKIYGGAA